MEQHIPKPIQHSQEFNKEGCNPGIIQQMEELCLKTNVWGEGLGKSLLQESDRMQFPRNEMQNNAVQ